MARMSNLVVDGALINSDICRAIQGGQPSLLFTRNAFGPPIGIDRVAVWIALQTGDDLVKKFTRERPATLRPKTRHFFWQQLDSGEMFTLQP